MHRRRAFVLEGAELFDAVPDHLRHGGDDRRHALALAVRRERHVEGFAAGVLASAFELELQPGVVVGAHVHRQRLGDGAEAARLAGPLTQTSNGQARPSGSTWPTNRANLPMRRVDHVGPARLPSGRFGRSGQRRLESTGAGRFLIDRRRLASPMTKSCGALALPCGLGLGSLVDREHRAEHAVRAVGGQTLEAGFPGAHVEILELLVGVVGRDVHRLRDRGVDVRGDGGDHVLVRLRRRFPAR